MKKEKDLVKEAADKMGFNMEYKAKEIFDGYNYHTDFNVDLEWEGHWNQVDIRAYLNKHQNFIVECKGSSMGSYLLLIKEPAVKHENYNSAPSFIIGNTGVELHQILYNAPTSTQLTFTGDFFHKKGEALAPTSKNIDDSNFFKAQIQLSESIFIQSKLDEPFSYHLPKSITPMILTNASIWVIDYEKSEQINCKWALHRVSLINHSLILMHGEVEIKWYILPVVNIRYLKEFLCDYDKNTKDVGSKRHPRVSDGIIEIDN